MPYRRRRFKKTYRRGRGRYGRYRRKRSYARGRRAIKVYAARQSARKYRFRKAIQQALHVETKWVKNTNADSNSTDVELILTDTLCNVGVGSGHSQRTGMVISITGVKLAAFVRAHPYALKGTTLDQLLDPGHVDVSYAYDLSVPVRIELWVDTQPEAGAITDMAALYEDTSPTVIDPTAFRNRDNTSRYRKLKTLKWNLQARAVTSVHDQSSGLVTNSTMVLCYSGGGVRTCHIKFKKPMVVKYDASAVNPITADEIQNRKLFLVLRRPQATPHLHYRWNAQIDYTDV